MNLIVAVDNNWAIGKNNDLLIKIPRDQSFFREQTTNKIVVMGRKTLESFPRSKPLKDRTNICFAYPWNEDYKGIRCKNWKEIYDVLKGDVEFQNYMRSTDPTDFLKTIE